MPNKEIITSLCYEKLKKFTKKTQMKEKFLITNFFEKQESLHYPKNSVPETE